MAEFYFHPFFIFAFPWHLQALFAALGFTSCMQTGMLLPHATNGHAKAKSGEKKRRREVKFSQKGKKIRIKFPAISRS